MTRALIVGYGNPLREDDGAGQMTVRRLQPRLGKAATAVTCHQLLPELAEPISQQDLVVFVDVSVHGTPGTVAVREVVAESYDASFTHHLTPEGLLVYAHVLYGRSPQAYLVTISGAAFGFEEKVSAAVETAVDDAVSQILQLLQAR